MPEDGAFKVILSAAMKGQRLDQNGTLKLKCPNTVSGLMHIKHCPTATGLHKGQH